MGTTGRLASLAYPNGQSTTYGYRPNLEDRRLETIHHKRASGATLSRFDFTYDSDGQILTKTHQVDGNPATRWTYAYDAIDQLIGATHTTTGGSQTELARYAYEYGSAGNRTLEQIDDSVVTATHDALNRLQTHVAGGALRIEGATSETATVKVQNRPMAVHADQTFAGTAEVTSGTNTLTIAATDPSGNTTARTYEVDVVGSGRTFEYDANGNLVSDGVRTFEWDAANRLVTMERAGERLELSYNGISQRVKLKRLAGGVTTSEQLALWGGSRIAELRDQVSGTTKRFYNFGVHDNGTSFFYTRDHLGSVTEVVEGDLLRGRHAFDAFGRRSRIAGDRDAEFGFAGLLTIGDADVVMATFRDYDTGTGRWLSQDPLGYIDGPNVYSYVLNDPVNSVDPLGLHVIGKIVKLGVRGMKVMRRGLNFNEAVAAARAGDDILCKSRRVAKEVAEELGGGKRPQHHTAPRRPGTEDYRPHYHPAGGKQHIFSSLFPLVTLEHWAQGHGAFAEWAGFLADFANPLSLPNDALGIFDDLTQEAPAGSPSECKSGCYVPSGPVG